MLLRHAFLTAAFALASLGSAYAAPWTETVIHTFNGTHGSNASPGVIADATGNLYGVTRDGGTDTYGVVYKLTPPAAGQTKWTETTLYTFPGFGAHGANPTGGLLFDSNGNLYGTTSMGGLGGDGVVFELKPPAPGHTQWTEQPLYNFPEGGADGAEPGARLVFDSRGNLYGTAEHAVFELSPPAAGKTQWTETLIQASTVPTRPPILDNSGNLYVAIEDTDATITELSPPTAGHTTWTPTVLYSFTDAAHGTTPSAVVFDTLGNLYGVTTAGGTSGNGTVFRLSPPTAGHTAWTETVLHSFNGTAGSAPQASLIFDTSGNLYGTTTTGGAFGDGVAFEMMAPAAGQTKWTFVLLRSLKEPQGGAPREAFTFSNGNLYSSTGTGGATGDGEVFELAPPH
jgi:uncharacterized repeat protein (TIGR03803 family)